MGHTNRFILLMSRTNPSCNEVIGNIVVMLVNQLQTQHPFDLPNTAWYHKSVPTFADAIALVRQ